MDPENNNYVRVHKKAAIALAILVLVIGAGLIGWWMGRSDSPTTSSSTVSDSSDDIGRNVDTSESEVSDIITYKLPSAWKDNTCEGSEDIFITPDETTANCNQNLVAPIKLSIDPGDTKDCNQLQNVSDVKKHVCISLYINDNRSLKATTEYLESSSYGKATTVDTYYIDTGKGVIKAEYIHTSDNQFQAGFDELVNSIATKK